MYQFKTTGISDSGHREKILTEKLKTLYSAYDVEEFVNIEKEFLLNEKNI